jgi:chemotaxis protein methyltransferase CheR
MIEPKSMTDLERLTPKQFELFQSFIYHRSGIKLEISKITLVSNRIRRRLRAGNFSDFDAYYRFLTSRAGTGELSAFLDAITTNETFFFRTQSHFDWLKQEYLPELARAKSDGKRSANLRFWSAACSTGEEPYSIAMAIAESSVLLRGWNIEILGTDISETTLAAAREAVYKRRAMQEMDAARIRRNFSEETGELYRLKPAIAQMVQFKHHNLLRPIDEPPFDCIWIRNVLIYFDRESKAKVVEHLVKSLLPGGYLVVGPSEGLYDMLTMLQKRTPFLYQKPKKDAS